MSLNPSNPRARPRWLVAGVGVVAALVLATGTILAGYVADANFEIDGDYVAGNNTAAPAGTGRDWRTIILKDNTTYPNATYPYGTQYGTPPKTIWDKGSATLIQDGHSKGSVKAETNIFSPAGKFLTPADWNVKAGSVGPSQNELTNIMVDVIPEGEIIGPGATDAADDTWLLLGMERSKKQGTFALDFELNQVAWNGTSGTLVRTPGDVAVGFELSGNPTSATDLQMLIIVYDPAHPSCTGPILGIAGNEEYDPALAGGSNVYGGGWCTVYKNNAGSLGAFGQASMNIGTVDAGPWGSLDDGGAARTSIGQFEVAEAALNLTELGLDFGCPGFGSAHAKTRSSLEPGSDLKDLAGPANLPLTCALSGSKYVDSNGDGSLTGDSKYTATGGWPIQIWKDNPSAGTFGAFDANDTLFKSLTTDASGNFSTEISNGSYFVCEETKSGWMQTFPSSGTNVTDKCDDRNAALDPDLGTYGYYVTISINNTNSAGNNFGNFQLIAKSGTKKVDSNGDGTITGDPAYQAGWTINLYKDNPTTGNVGALDSGDALTAATTSTAAATYGQYSFPNLGPGTYFVCEATKTGWQQTFPKAGSSVPTGETLYTACDTIVTNEKYGYKFTTASGTNLSGDDFGNFERIAKSGSKYVDANGDGLLAGDSKYTVTGGWNVRLYLDNASAGAQGTLDANDTQVTGSPKATTAGDYSFTGLVPGTYFACEETKAGWQQTYPNASTANPTGETVYNACDNITGLAKFGYKFTAASGVNLSANHFGNAEQFRLIVFTCSQSTGQLVVSTVDLDGAGTGFAQQDTISSALLKSLAGTTPAALEAYLCDLGSVSGTNYGQYNNLNRGTYDAIKVVLPKPQ